MSSQKLQDFIKKKLIPDMDEFQDNKARSARTQISETKETPNQFFVFDKDAIMNEINHVIRETYGSYGSGFFLTPKMHQNYLKKYRTYLRRVHDKQKTTKRGEYLHFIMRQPGFRKAHMKQKEIPAAAEIFIVHSFKSMRDQKRIVLANAVIDEVKTIPGYKNMNKEQEAGLRGRISGKPGATPAGTDQLGIQLGHGEYSLSASEMQYAKAKREIHRAMPGLTSKDKKLLVQVMEEHEEELGFKVDHDQILDAQDKLIKDYYVIISTQSTGSNEEDKNREQAALDAFRAKATALINHPSSTLLPDAIAQIMLSRLTKATRKTKALVTFIGNKPKNSIKENSKARVKDTWNVTSFLPFAIDKVDSKKLANVIKSKDKNAGAKAKSSRNTSRAGMSPIALMALLNEKLPESVLSNMGSPTLENRTGRFASSTRVTNILNNPKGSIIQYTYQRNPYQVFEGGPKSDGGNRDPRKLIDISLREVAAQMMIGRFTTQRV